MDTSVMRGVWSLVSANGQLAVPERRLERLVVGVSALLTALLLCAVWGAAATPLGVHAALGNAVKVPMLVLVSGLACLPAFVLACRLVVAKSARATDLLTAYGVSVLAGGMVLAALAPLVALYQHSSAWAGPHVALGSAILAFVAGAMVFMRALGRLSASGYSAMHNALAMGVLVLGHLLALSQLSSSTSSVFAERTRFGHGIDALRNAPPAADKGGEVP